MNVQADELVKVVVDPAKVGLDWPIGVAAMIEAHERKHIGCATRKEIHVLIDRYVAAYLPGVEVSYARRREIIRLLRSRYFHRWMGYVRTSNRAYMMRHISGREVPELGADRNTNSTTTTDNMPEDGTTKP